MEYAARISVIVPTRNRLEFLREALASVCAQEFTDWELIVVDDCSEDGTWNWLQSLGERRIRALRLEHHRERAAARNAGLQAASGEYVLFLDDDDWLLDGALAHLYDALRRRPTVIAAVGALIYKNNWGSWNRATHPRHRVLQNVWPDLLFGWVPLPSQTLLRRSAVVEAGGWNEALSLAEDNELWLRLARLGPVAVIPQPVVSYRLHPGQTVKAGVRQVGTELRRSAVAGRSEEEKQRAERSILAHRLIDLAWRAHGRGDAWAALRWWWRAVLSAPWLLASPPSRGLLVEPGVRSLASAVLRDRPTEILRKVKRACIRAYRGKLRSPALGVPPAKTPRRAGGRS